jgi:hypothetical protein
MAMRDQPYIPFYCQDYATDEKLAMCSYATQGVYMLIICALHKSEPYGGILYREIPNQNLNTVKTFAYILSRRTGVGMPDMEPAIEELVYYGVLLIKDIDGTPFLYQKRMVRDNEISEKRSEAGKLGGERSVLLKQNSKQNNENMEFCLSKTESKRQANAQANDKQNPEDENENESVFENDFEVDSGVNAFDVEDVCNSDSSGEAAPGVKSPLNKAQQERFDRFWNAYPVKKGKGGARRSWKVINPDDALLERMLTAIDTARKHDRAWREGYIPHPQTWLNQARWEDVIDARQERLPSQGPRYGPQEVDKGQIYENSMEVLRRLKLKREAQNGAA